MSHRYSSSGSSRDARRHSSSSRRDSPPRRRRSPSPGPSRGRSPKARDPMKLPSSFGHVDKDYPDRLDVLRKMKSSYVDSPLHDIYQCIVEKRKVKIWTRNYKHVRGILTAYVLAFDKHWNFILRDVDEVYLKPKKAKTPFLRDILPNEVLQDMPVRVPREKKTSTEDNEASAPPPPSKPEEKKKRKKKSKTITDKRFIKKLFVRGDNVVMVHPLEDDLPEQSADDTLDEDEDATNKDDDIAEKEDSS